MKKNRIISLFLSAAVLLAAGCQADPASAEIETIAPNAQADESETTDHAEETEPTEENFYPMRAGEGKRVFEEGKKIVESMYPETDFHDYELLNQPTEKEDPTLSDQIYRALYDFSVFFQYMDSQYLDTLAALSDEALTVESIGFYGFDQPKTDKDFVHLVQSRYPRIKNGEITTIWEYYSRFFQVATLRFKDSDAHLFQKQFALSNGNLYYNAEAIRLTYRKASSGSRLNRIRKIVSEDEKERLELSFTASYEDFGTPYTEDYTVVLEYSDRYGWRVDECGDPYAVGFLVSEILEGGRNHESPKTNLPKEIELRLEQIGLKTESKEDEVSLEELFADTTHNYRELNKPKETENPTMAEQIYKTLYDFADFYDYRNCYMSFFMDRNDAILVERVIFRSNRDLENSPELFGRQDWEKYCRITGGRITTAKEYFYRLCQCASDHYLANSNRDDFETAFQLSDGNLYLTEYAWEYYHRAPASSVLNEISRIDENRLLLSFTAETRSLKPEIDDTVYTEQYTVTMSYEHDRWKVDECDSSAMERLCNEIIQGGTTGADPKTDLPAQIERCLKESGLM